MYKPKAIVNWSGGKDSALALYKALQSNEYEISYLLTTVSSGFKRIIQHGVREELLDKQADSIGISLYKLFLPENPEMDTYNSLIKETLINFKKENIHTGIFGDIFLEDLRKYREDKLAEVNVKAVFPIWKISSSELIKEFIDLGFKAVVVCVNENNLDKSFAGREIDADFVKDLPSDVDPCGENGEYHSYVYDGPIFKKPIKFQRGDIIKKIYTPSKSNQLKGEAYPQVPETVFWYCDLIAG
jgi:uncharacterized protein (TIGR00290 family)